MALPPGILDSNGKYIRHSKPGEPWSRKDWWAWHKFFSPNASHRKRKLVTNLVKIELPSAEIKQAPLHYEDQTLLADSVPNKVLDKIPVRGHSPLKDDFWEAIDLLTKTQRISKKQKKAIILYVQGGYYTQEIADKLHVTKVYTYFLIRKTLAAIAEYFAEDFGYIYTKAEEKPTLKFTSLEIPDSMSDFIPGGSYRD
jgi:predicted DNA-binding protein YlxM (UPF0122 family)